jgi:hypothetical protein
MRVLIYLFSLLGQPLVVLLLLLFLLRLKMHKVTNGDTIIVCLRNLGNQRIGTINKQRSAEVASVLKHGWIIFFSSSDIVSIFLAFGYFDFW